MIQAIQHVRVEVVIVLLTISEGALKSLLVRNSGGRWALPCGAVFPKEPLRQAAERVIREQVGVKVDYLEQLYTFGNEVPRKGERRVQVAYYGLIPSVLLRTEQLADSHMARWFAPAEQPRLFGEDSLILRVATDRLRGKLAYTAVGFELLPERFTLAELQNLYEVILGKLIDKRNFRKKIGELGILERTGEERLPKGRRGRPASLYRFKRDVFKQIENKGNIFPF